MAFRGVKTPGRLDDYLKLEIEHILPNTPEPDFKKAFEQDNPNTQYDVIKNRLGNLTLLEKPINIVAGRKYFEAKKPEYEKSGNYLTKSIMSKASVGQNTSVERINKMLISFENWGVLQIEQRQEMLMTLAREIWAIDDVAA